MRGRFLGLWILEYIILSPCIVVILLLAYGNVVDMYDHWKRAHGEITRTKYSRENITELHIENSEENSISLAFKMKNVKTKDAKEAETSHANNQKLKLDICRAVAAKIPEDEICLVARSGSVYKRRDEGEIKPEDERARSFRLDLCHSWEKKKNDEWLAGYKTLKNKEGYIIGIYGADEKVIESGYEIYVPKAKEEELECMTLTELLKFCEAENCKMQIREKGSVYIFSEISGYTKEEATREIGSVAEKNGIKVKNKRKGKNK